MKLTLLITVMMNIIYKNKGSFIFFQENIVPPDDRLDQLQQTVAQQRESIMLLQNEYQDLGEKLKESQLEVFNLKEIIRNREKLLGMSDAVY